MVPKRSDHFFDLLKFPEEAKENALKLKFPEEAKEDALKLTMVNQEHVFRTQVQELHRVYQMQMVMMKNSRSKEMSETQYMNYSRDEYCRNRSQHSGYYTNCRNEHFIRKGNGLGTQEKPIDVEFYFHGETKARMKKEFTPASSPRVINLEEKTESFFKRENKSESGFVGAGCSARPIDQNCLHSIHKSISGNTKRSLSFLDETTNFRGKSSLNQDYEENRYEISTTSKATMFDLNEPPCDESSFNLNDQIEIDSPEGLLDLNCFIKPNDNSTNGGSNLSSMDLKSCGKIQYENSEDQECLTSDWQRKDEFGVKSGCRNRNVEEDSVEKADIEMSFVSSIPSNTLKTTQSMSNSSQHKGEFGLNSGFRNSNGNEDSVEKADIEMSFVSSIPSNSLKTMQSMSNFSQHKGEFGLKSDCRNSNGKEGSVEKTDIDMSLVSSNPSNTLTTVAYSESSTPALNSESSQVDSMGNENEQSALDDDLIRRGAVSLLYFMMENSSTGQNQLIHENQPQHSLDSFESAVLKLQESKVDFNDVSSNHYEIKQSDEKDYPIKLRRGRRMKDFQKDILPSMASLSRHEICEDVRLMEGVIRSREYKRLQSKDSGDQKWFTPVKSRRSRLNNTGRRFYN